MAQLASGRAAATHLGVLPPAVPCARRQVSLIRCLCLCSLLGQRLAADRLVLATAAAIFIGLARTQPSAVPLDSELTGPWPDAAADNDDDDDDDDQDQTAYPNIRALAGQQVVGLPCNISQSNEGNTIKLVLWYKNTVLGSPLYSLDARDAHNMSQARHFVANDYRDRARFELSLAGRTALLFLSRLQEPDHGLYICRVDYRWTRTTISNVRLEVIVPPLMLQLIQSYHWIGPKSDSATAVQPESNRPRPRSLQARFNHTAASVLLVRQPENSLLSLSCDSMGGKPMPVVKWFRLAQWERANLTDAQLLALLQSSEEAALQLADDNYHWASDGRVRNELVMGVISADQHHGRLYLCRAANSNLTKPIDLAVRLQVLAGPKQLSIQQRLPATGGGSDGSDTGAWHSIELLDHYLQQRGQARRFRVRSGFEADFVCQSNGSRPAARIFWYLRDGRNGALRNITQLSIWQENGSDGTLSYLRLVPQFTDHRAQLVCQAYNPVLHEALSRHSDSVSAAGSVLPPQVAAEHEQQQPFQLYTWVHLDVNYKPIVAVRVLSGQQMYREVAANHSTGRLWSASGDSARYQFGETEDIFLNCSVNSNPEPHSTKWYHGAKLLGTDVPKGIIITNMNRTLIISPSSRRSAGPYQCRAANILGESESDVARIEIHFKPQCQTTDSAVATYYRRLGDQLHLRCRLLANPGQQLPVVWKFNDSTLMPEAYGAPVRQEDQAVPGSYLVSSLLRVHLRHWNSFGRFACVARNSVGVGACRWQVLPQHLRGHSVEDPAGSGQLADCHIIESSNAVVVNCGPDSDPSLTYHVQAYRLPGPAENQQYSHQKSPEQAESRKQVMRHEEEPDPGTVTLNFSNPLFIITNLSASSSYLLRIWSNRLHSGAVLEQLNLTVRTKPEHGAAERELPVLPETGPRSQIDLGLAMAMLVSVSVLGLTLAFAATRIRAGCQARRERNGNRQQSGEAPGGPLCEMRPETLLDDLEKYHQYSVLKPYVGVESAEQPGAGLLIGCEVAESSLVAYQNYLFPVPEPEGHRLQLASHVSVHSVKAICLNGPPRRQSAAEPNECGGLPNCQDPLPLICAAEPGCDMVPQQQQQQSGSRYVGLVPDTDGHSTTAAAAMAQLWPERHTMV